MPRSPHLARRSMAVALSLALASLVISMVSTGVGLAATTSPPATSPAAQAAQITVSPAQPLATVPGTAIGINASSYDASLLGRPVPALLRQAGISVVRLPGGSESDQYDWKTSTDVISSQAEAVDFSQFMSVVRQAGAQAMVTVDYGTGDTIGQQDGSGETGPQIAADWVRYANVEHHYGIRYWEIGNEVYGNGTYGADWEADAHCTTTPAGGPVVLGREPGQTYDCGPATYAASAAQYIKAMKAVDPRISVGVVLTASGAPNNWPDGVTNPATSPQSWNQTVLSALGSQLGFADVHWYPQNPATITPPGPADAGLLADTAQTPFPAYYGLQLPGRFIQPGDQLLTTSSSQGLVQVFAARAAGGQLRVLLVNDDPATSFAPSLSVPGYRLSPAAPVLFYGPASSALQTLTGAQARAAAATVAPYSITMLTLTRA